MHLRSNQGALVWNNPAMRLCGIHVESLNAGYARVAGRLRLQPCPHVQASFVRSAQTGDEVCVHILESLRVQLAAAPSSYLHIGEQPCAPPAAEPLASALPGPTQLWGSPAAGGRADTEARAEDIAHEAAASPPVGAPLTPTLRIDQAQPQQSHQPACEQTRAPKQSRRMRSRPVLQARVRSRFRSVGSAASALPGPTALWGSPSSVQSSVAEARASGRGHAAPGQSPESLAAMSLSPTVPMP